MASGTSGSSRFGLTNNQKRWLVHGIALNKILTPQIRPFVEQGINNEYNNLKTSHNIHGQSSSGRLQRWPTLLKYENINANNVHPRLPGKRLNYSSFDCRVISPVDFARLYVENHMANFTAFDDHCDASAVLSLLSRVPVFSAAIQAAAGDVRAARNDWAHCVFSEWDEAKFQQSFLEMGHLVMELKLPAADEETLLTELKDWENRGTHLCMKSLVDPLALKSVQENLSSLKDEVKKISEDWEEKSKVLSALQHCADAIEDLTHRVVELEGCQQNLESRVDDIEVRVAKLEEVQTLLREPHLPAEGEHFTGRRKECEDIINQVTSESARIVGVYGPPGFGKSQVAIAVGNELKFQGKRVYHFELSGVKTCDELLSKFLYYSQLSPRDNYITKHLKPIDLFCMKIENIRDNLYFILDDMDNLLQPNVRDEFASLIKEILTKCPKMTFIITCRESFTLYLESFCPKVIRVGPLNKLYAPDLVQKLIPITTKDERKKISHDLCEDMPLAIMLLCESILKSEMSVTENITDFKKSMDCILESFHKTEDDRSSKLIRIFETSFQRLTSQSDEDAFLSLAVIPDSFEENVAAAVLGLEKAKAKGVLERLHRRSLLEKNCGSYKMHKLIKSFAMAKGESERKELFLSAKTRFCGHNISLLSELNKRFLSGNNESKSAAHGIFFNKKQNIVTSLIEGCLLGNHTRNKALDVLSEAELFLDTLLWRDIATFNKIYDTAIAEAEKCGDSAAFNRMVIAKAFSEVTWTATEVKTMQLVPSIFEEKQQSKISDLEKGKCACYFGIYQLVNGKNREGVQLLESFLSKLEGTKDPLLKILEVLCSQILSLYYESKKNLKRALEMYQNARERCKNVVDQNLLFVPEMLCEYKSMRQERMAKDDCQLRIQPLPLLMYFLIAKATNTFVSIRTAEAFQANFHILLEQESVEDPAKGYKTSMMYFDQFVVEILDHMGNCQEAKKFVQTEITRLKKVQKRASDQDSQRDEYKNVTETLAKSYSSLAVFQFRENEYEDSLKSQERALDLTLEIFGENHENTALIYLEVGVILRNLRRYSQALEYQHWALDVRISSDASSSKTADNYHELGVTQFCMGEYSAALESHQKALHIRFKNHGDHHRDIARSYNELGVTQRHLEKYEDALSSHMEGNRISIEVFGKKTRETADSYHELGKTYFCLKKYRKASRSHQQALRIRQQLLGEEDVETADSYFELGVSQFKLKRYDLALKNHQCALGIRLKIRQGQDAEIARSYRYLGRMQYKEVEYNQAIQSHKYALYFRKHLFGENHRETAESYYEWGKTSFHKEDLAKALVLLERSLVINESKMGKDHEKTGDNLYQLGLVRWKIHRLEESLRTNQRALNIRLKSLGKYHNKKAKSFYQLGLVYDGLGRFKSAVNSHLEALKIRKEILGDFHAETARSYLEVGTNQFKVKDYNSAHEKLQNALEITTELLAEQKANFASLSDDTKMKNLNEIDPKSGLHFYQRVSRMYQERLAFPKSIVHSLGKLKKKLADIADTYNDLAEREYMAIRVKDFTTALNVLERALDIRLRLFGNNHPDVAVSYFHIGYVQYHMKFLMSSLESHERALEIRRKLNMENLREAATIYNSMGCAHFKMKNFRFAIKLFERSLELRLAVHGEYHEDTVQSYYNIGLAQECVQDFRSALESHQHVLDIRLKKYGEGHPDTAQSYRNIRHTKLQMEIDLSAPKSFRSANGSWEVSTPPTQSTAHRYYNIGQAQLQMKNEMSTLQSFQRAKGPWVYWKIPPKVQLRDTTS